MLWLAFKFQLIRKNMAFLKIVNIDGKDVVINSDKIVGLYQSCNTFFVVTEGSYTTYMSEDVFKKLKKYLMGELI